MTGLVFLVSMHLPLSPPTRVTGLSWLVRTPSHYIGRDEFLVSLAQDMSLLDNWPLLISFEQRPKRSNTLEMQDLATKCKRGNKTRSCHWL